MMRTLQTTKGRAVERVIPLSSLSYTSVVSKSEIEEVLGCNSSEYDSGWKALWRMELFKKYANRFLECGERIFTDERVFNTPIPIKVVCCSNMRPHIFEPYLVRPTLGQFIYWWQTYKCSQVELESRFYPILCWSVNLKFMSVSSSFARSNSIFYVDSDGKQYGSKLEMHNLYNLSKSFHEVCRLYPATEYEHFDLEDAIEYLFGERCSR